MPIQQYLIKSVSPVPGAITNMSNLEKSKSKSDSDIQRMKAALWTMASGNKSDQKALSRLLKKLGMHYFELIEKLDDLDFTAETIEKILKEQEITDANNNFVFSRMKQLNIVRTGLSLVATLTFLVANYVGDREVAGMALGVLAGSSIPELVTKNNAKRP